MKNIPDFLNRNVLVFDTETTGLGADAKVVEYGFSMFQNGEHSFEVSQRIHPGVFPEGYSKAAAIHHIYEEDLVGMPTFAEKAQEVYNMLSVADVICAYNYEYDRRIIGNELAACGLEFPQKPVIDVMIFYKKFYKMTKGKKLVDAAANFGFNYVGAHSAGADSTMAGRVLMRMASVQSKFPKSLVNALQQQRELVENQFIEFASYKARSGVHVTPPNLTYFDLNQMGYVNE